VVRLRPVVQIPRQYLNGERGEKEKRGIPHRVEKEKGLRRSILNKEGKEEGEVGEPRTVVHPRGLRGIWGGHSILRRSRV